MSKEEGKVPGTLPHEGPLALRRRERFGVECVSLIRKLKGPYRKRGGEV